MKTRNILVAAMLVATVVPSWSRPRTKSEILQAASSTLIKSQPGMMRSPFKAQKLEVISQNAEYSVVGFDGGSYSIISNDDMFPAVLAYSSTPFDGAEENPGFKWWSNAIRKVMSDRLAAEEAADRTLPDPSRFPTRVPKLLSDVWGQMEPHNNLCPLEYDQNGKLIGRCVVGCVATSATQVMHYHQYPPQGHGVHIDMQTEDAFGKPVPLKVDFKDYKFDWANMRDSYSAGNYTEEEAAAVANLSYPVGVSFGMIYGTGASGTYSDSAVVSLREHLGFENARLMVRREYNEKVWMETIYNELSHSRPVLYSGADKWGTVGGGGHAFVLDGYNEEGLVHVNWGWYGRNDGYYEVALLNPRIHSFVDQQDMIIGVAPPNAPSGDAVVLKLTGKLTSADLRDAVEKSMYGKANYLDLTEATLPDGFLPDKCFYGSRFTKIYLPENTTSIGTGVFANCRDLREVVFPKNMAACDYFVEDDIIYSKDGTEVIAVLPYYSNNKAVIVDYTSLLTFRDGVKVIRKNAAEGCHRVQGVEIPATIEKIETDAFKNIPTLKIVKCYAALPPHMAAAAFATLDPGYTTLLVPAGTPDAYMRSGEWGKFFAFDNVAEFGTNVMANNIVRKQGEANPELTYRIYGEYVTGEPELSCEAKADSKPGDYVIKVSMGSLKGDDITLTDGFLRILDPAAVEDIAEEEFTGAVYSIDGRLVLQAGADRSSLPKGVYISEGKKIIIR